MRKDTVVYVGIGYGVQGAASRVQAVSRREKEQGIEDIILDVGYCVYVVGHKEIKGDEKFQIRQV